MEEEEDSGLEEEEEGKGKGGERVELNTWLTVVGPF